MNNIYDHNCYKCTLLRVVDGDTLEVNVDLGLRVQRWLYVRLAGINAPELRGADRAAGKASAKEAARIFAMLEATGLPVRVQFSRGKSFDRWLGRVFVVDADGVETDFAEQMILSGHATRA